MRAGAAEKGLLYLLPYDNPWSWMNDTAVRMVDEMVEAAREKYALPDDIPVVACGGSMGGLSCLIYTLRAKRTPAACAANCRYSICLIIIPSARTAPYHLFGVCPLSPATLWKRSKPRPIASGGDYAGYPLSDCARRCRYGGE